jgi:phospho-N-acetylmuramoyl-pentapeptide-transferase
MVSYLFAPFLIGTLVALLSGWLLLPILKKLKARQVVSSDAPQRHQAKGGTPTMGGVILLAGGVVATLTHGMTANRHLVWAVLLCTLAFGLIGFLDDLLSMVRGRNLGLRAREKLLGQFLIALLFAGWFYLTDPGVTAPGADPLRWTRIALALFHVLLLVGMSNSVNLTDGLDGLAAGVTLPVWITLALLGGFWTEARQTALAGVGEWGVVALCAAFAGGTLGYLWYNAHPAQVFMGDTGSLAIGGGLAAAAIVMRLEWALLLAALVPIAEAGSVTLQVIWFKRTGRRIFKMSPLHHHFELSDWPETRIVARFAIISALCGLLALCVVFWS